MNVQELRIGNYVKVSLINKVRIKGIHPKTILCEESESLSGKDEFADMIEYEGSDAWGYAEIEEFSPIPLTEEILLKCGFKTLSEFDEIWIKKENYINILFTLIPNVYIGKDKNTGFYHFLHIYTVQEIDYFNAISAPMEYLHTLQNYYVTFKGQELEINL